MGGITHHKISTKPLESLLGAYYTKIGTTLKDVNIVDLAYQAEINMILSKSMKDRSDYWYWCGVSDTYKKLLVSKYGYKKLIDLEPSNNELKAKLMELSGVANAL